SGRLNALGFVIYPGKVSGADCFRIGTIGRIFPDDVRALLRAVEICSQDLLAPARSGSRPASEVSGASETWIWMGKGSKKSNSNSAAGCKIIGLSIPQTRRRPGHVPADGRTLVGLRPVVALRRAAGPRRRKSRESVMGFLAGI